ncbi:MAG: type I 3-dehydroquinate dehydratase [Georgenia sp.]
MSPAVTVRGVTLGAGMPKVIVPLTGRTRRDLATQAEVLVRLPAGERPDLVEWRADHFADVADADAVRAVCGELAATLGDIPLLFTFRTAREGGARAITDDDYASLNLAVAESGSADLVDVELATVDVAGLVARLRAAGVTVVVSSHDFEATPPAEVIVDRLRRIRRLGADLPKVAVMPRSPADVLVLLAATWTASQESDRPIITMAMGADGVVSRIAGEIFGSAATFAMVGESSAPGQVPLPALRASLALVHAARERTG